MHETGRWTEEEHNTFVKCYEMIGRDWKTISKCIPTRSIVQVRTHAQKYFEQIRRNTEKSELIALENKV